MNDDKHTLSSGTLSVGDGHKIYYQRWGSPKAPPTFFLHGGPGGGCKDKHKLNFDPKRHQIIYHDQRGSGKSTPFASVKNNNTQALISDIEKLRQKFGFTKIQLTGGSWGSFLALAYAAVHPENVSKVLISGIFTGTKTEIDYIQQGGLKTHFPEAWEQYLELVPTKHRHNTVKYYSDKMKNGTPEEIAEHVAHWVLLERSAMSIDNDYKAEFARAKDYDETARALAILEAHYFLNNCFVDDKFLYSNAAALKDIKIIMVHGRYDHVCTPQSAYRLSKKIGSNCHLHIVPGSHANEGALREASRAYAWSFLG